MMQEQRPSRSQGPNLQYILYDVFELDHLVGEAWHVIWLEGRGKPWHKLEMRGRQALPYVPVKTLTRERNNTWDGDPRGLEGQFTSIYILKYDGCQSPISII